jgi:phenylalanyl-tRNA synthetase alpha chain
MDKLKFKPAYNPYTEPSMEIFRYKIMNSCYACTACKVIGNLMYPIYFSYHEGLGKWVEIGNSGMFRPEMLRPMGFSEDVNVIAWGLSLER